VHGIASETPEALQRDGDITIAHAEDVEPLWRQLGRHDGLGLGGRPAEPLGPLATAEVLAAPGRRLVVAPALFNRQGSYLALDNRLLVGDIEAELAYLARHARGPGQPLFTLWVTAPMLDAPGAEGLIDFLRRLAVPGGGEASAHAGPLDAESPAAMGPDASPPDPVPPGAGSPSASSPAVVPSRSADRPVLPVRVGPLATLIGQATTRSLDWLAELPAPLRPAPPPAGAAATAPVPALLAPWDEAATHPLSAARRAGIEASPDAPALWARLAHSANPFEQVAVLGRLATLAGLEARPAPLPDGAPGTAPEGASCTAPEGASCTAPEGATSKSPAGATSPSPDLPSAAPPAAASVRQRLQALHDRAAARRHWGLLRRAAAVLDAPDDLLEDGVARLMAQQKRLRLGAPGSPRAVVARALGQGELQAWLHEGTGADAQGRVLVQELVLLLGTLVKAEPALFDGVLTLRPAELLQRLVARAAKEHDLPQAAAFEHLLALSPQALRARLRDLLAATCSPAGPRVLGPAAVPRRAGRQTAGTVARLGGDFPVRLWQLLRRVGGLEIGAAHDGQHRLDPALAQAEMTAGERGFALHLEACLDRIASPAWRQLSIEALQALAALPADDAAFAGAPTLVIDELLEAAARRCQAPADVNPGDEVPAEQAPTAGERPEAVPSEDAAPEDAVPARAPPAPLDATAVLLSVDPAILAAHVSAAARQRAQAALPQAPEGQEGLGAPSTSAVEAST
jgi:phosphorylase kinase alpha/beta subunit